MNITDIKWQFLKWHLAGISSDAKIITIHFAMYPHASLKFISPRRYPPIIAVLLPHMGINKEK